MYCTETEMIFFFILSIVCWLRISMTPFTLAKIHYASVRSFFIWFCCFSTFPSHYEWSILFSYLPIYLFCFVLVKPPSLSLSQCMLLVCEDLKSRLLNLARGVMSTESIHVSGKAWDNQISLKCEQCWFTFIMISFVFLCETASGLMMATV